MLNLTWDERGTEPRRRAHAVPDMSPSDRSASSEIEWRPVPGYPNHEVSNFGQVRRSRAFRQYLAGMLMAQKLDLGGYLQVGLSRDGRTRCFGVHRLVALAFLGGPPSRRHQAAHNDGNRKNNHISNLRWATPSENSMDRALHGTVPDRKGERHPMAKLNDELVLELREQRHRGCTYPELAQRYGIPKLTVYDAVVGTTWQHLPGAVGAHRQSKSVFGNCK